jgi:hypothetical protein|tara:strand:- start:2064 stop:2300 length:237 start_codon:yes stop_codon:yes gene_type:complete
MSYLAKLRRVRFIDLATQAGKAGMYASEEYMDDYGMTIFVRASDGVAILPAENPLVDAMVECISEMHEFVDMLDGMPE